MHTIRIGASTLTARPRIKFHPRSMSACRDIRHFSPPSPTAPWFQTQGHGVASKIECPVHEHIEEPFCTTSYEVSNMFVGTPDTQVQHGTTPESGKAVSIGASSTNLLVCFWGAQNYAFNLLGLQRYICICVFATSGPSLHGCCQC